MQYAALVAVAKKTRSQYPKGVRDAGFIIGIINVPSKKAVRGH